MIGEGALVLTTILHRRTEGCTSDTGARRSPRHFFLQLSVDASFFFRSLLVFSEHHVPLHFPFFQELVQHNINMGIAMSVRRQFIAKVAKFFPALYAFGQRRYDDGRNAAYEHIQYLDETARVAGENREYLK